MPSELERAARELVEWWIKSAAALLPGNVAFVAVRHGETGWTLLDRLAQLAKAPEPTGEESGQLDPCIGCLHHACYDIEDLVCVRKAEWFDQQWRPTTYDEALEMWRKGMQVRTPAYEDDPSRGFNDMLGHDWDHALEFNWTFEVRDVKRN